MVRVLYSRRIYTVIFTDRVSTGGNAINRLIPGSVTIVRADPAGEGGRDGLGAHCNRCCSSNDTLIVSRHAVN